MDERDTLVAWLKTKFATKYEKLIESSIDFLIANESKWGLTVRTDPYEYVSNLVRGCD